MRITSAATRGPLSNSPLVPGALVQFAETFETKSHHSSSYTLNYYIVYVTVRTKYIITSIQFIITARFTYDINGLTCALDVPMQVITKNLMTTTS